MCHLHYLPGSIQPHRLGRVQGRNVHLHSPTSVNLAGPGRVTWTLQARYSNNRRRYFQLLL